MFTEEDSEGDLYRYKITETDKTAVWYRNNKRVKVNPIRTIKNNFSKVQIICENNCYLILVEDIKKEVYIETPSIFFGIFDVLITLPDLGEHDENMGEYQ